MKFKNIKILMSNLIPNKTSPKGSKTQMMKKSRIKREKSNIKILTENYNDSAKFI